MVNRCSSYNDVISVNIIRLIQLKATEVERQLTTGKRAERTKRDFDSGAQFAALNLSRRYNNKKHVTLTTLTNSSTIKSKLRIAPCKWTQHCWVLHVAPVCTLLLHAVARSLKRVKLLSEQLPTFLLFRDRRGVAQQCWIRLHSYSNIVRATHAPRQNSCLKKSRGLYPSHDALQVPTLLGVVASVCTPSPIRTQHLPTLLAQQCWELLCPFARSLR